MRKGLPYGKPFPFEPILSIYDIKILIPAHENGELCLILQPNQTNYIINKSLVKDEKENESVARLAFRDNALCICQ